MSGGPLPIGFDLHRGWAPALDLHHAVASLPLVQREIKLYGQVCPVPRLTAWMGEASYVYSGIAHAPAAMPPWLVALRTEVEAKTGARFNSVLANYYRNGSDSVAWHADDETELGEQPTIASVSFGASRRFAVRERAGAGSRRGERWDTILEHGDLLVMSGRSQLDYLHSVPKTARKVDPRLNLTFRWIHV